MQRRKTDRGESSDQQLLVATTGEPMQPVRLYYAATGQARAAAVSALRGLRCVGPGRETKTLEWLHSDEAANLDFHKWAPAAKLGAAPALLGVWSLRDRRLLTLTVRSFHRATLAARFFAPRLGSGVELVRARVVNRWFDASELGSDLDLHRLDAHLDRNVVVIDPRVAERELEDMLSQARTPEELERLCAENVERKRNQDIPEVEDFPLAPEGETPDFRDLEMTLMLRWVRAGEHWKGNTGVSLADIIVQLTEQSSFEGVSRSQ